VRIHDLIVKVFPLVVADEMRADVFVARILGRLRLVSEDLKEYLRNFLLEIDSRKLADHPVANVFGKAKRESPADSTASPDSLRRATGFNLRQGHATRRSRIAVERRSHTIEPRGHTLPKWRNYIRCDGRSNRTATRNRRTS
jgi:hypothetical protein